MNLRAVLFDLDDTLRFSRPSYREVLRRTLEEAGYPIAEPRWRDFGRWSHAFWAGSEALRRLRTRYRDDSEAFWRAWTEEVLRFFGVPDEDLPRVADLVEAAAARWAETVEDWVPPEVPQTLERLRRIDLRLALVTNRGRPLEPDYLERLGLARFFDAVVVAADAGIYKPDPRLFLQALDALGVPPSQALHVGDNYYADVRGAQAAGLHAVLMDPHDLFADLPVPRIRRLPELWPYIEKHFDNGGRPSPAEMPPPPASSPADDEGSPA